MVFPVSHYPISSTHLSLNTGQLGSLFTDHRASTSDHPLRLGTLILVQVMTVSFAGLLNARRTRDRIRNLGLFLCDLLKS